MHRIPPKRARGLTLIELVVVMVITAIIVASTVYFFNPVRQSVDLVGRAELTDIADNALQRMGRDVRLALPNSVRVDGTKQYLEFLPIRTAGRYRAAGGGGASGVSCPDNGPGAPASDQLSFTSIVDSCFKTIGAVADAASVTTRDFLAFNNYGPTFTGQDAYVLTASSNTRQIAAFAADSTRFRIDFTATAFPLFQSIHDSPGKRFFIVSGRAAGAAQPEPVSYVCAPSPAGGTLTRRWGYDVQATQPTAFATGTSAVIASNVTACNFDYALNVAPMIGLLTIRLTIAKALSGGAVETVTLYHAVHVNNVP